MGQAETCQVRCGCPFSPYPPWFEHDLVPISPVSGRLPWPGRAEKSPSEQGVFPDLLAPRQIFSGWGQSGGLFLTSAHLQTIPIMLMVSLRVCGEHAWDFSLRFPPAWQGAGLAPKPTNFCAAIKKYLCNSWERFLSHRLGFAKPKIDLGLLF